MWLCRIAVVFVLACAVGGGPCAVAADDAPQRAANGDPLVVRDVAVYLLSAYGEKLNERGLFQSTLPSYTLSRRPTAPRDSAIDPSPAGIITFAGPPENDIDVLLEFDNGRFLSHWPPGRMRAKRLLWASIDIAETSAIDPSSMFENHWMLPLRDAQRLFAVGNKHADRFLMYDAELPYAPHVTLARDEDGYTVTNTGKFPIHDVVVYRPSEDDTWDVAAAAQVDAAKTTPKEEADEKEGTDKPDGQPQPEGTVEAAPVQASPAAFAPAKAAPAGAQPAASEKPDGDEPRPPIGVTAQASLVGALTADDVIDAWRGTLEELQLQQPEIAFVQSILRQQALRNDGAMLVYRLDETQIEKLMPLEVTPYPDRVFRVAIVIVQDADPDLQSQIEKLVTQLGDDDWRTRESAQEGLTKLGLAAKPKLEAALMHDDAEIVFRAEQLLEALRSDPL